jgi:dolichol-phosphate mannosyltransferase
MISIILPTYNEESNLLKLYECLSHVTEKMIGHDFEFIFVDDCSRDRTPYILQDIAKTDDRVKTIRFARNCGSHAAVAAGLRFCRGDVAIMLAADLQDPPEIIPRLLEEWEKGYKVVWGVRDKREGENFFTLASSRTFYFLMNRLTNVSQPPTGADIFLIDRTVIDAFNNSPEKNTSVYMLIAWLGYTQTYITYVKEARHAGTSKWTTSKRLKLFFDSLISFSYVPLRFMSLMGAISAFLGLLYGLVVFVNALRGNPVAGWASLMIVVLLIGGFQMIMMGMLGEYLWRTYDETRGRPRYVIEKNTLVDSTSNCRQKRLNED